VSHLGRRLSALIDGELSEAEQDRVLTHLASCEPCRREASALRTLKRRMNSLGGDPAGDGDSALANRLMSLASAGFVFGEQGRDPAWSWPAAFPVAVAGPRELRPGRTVVAGAVAFLVVGLGAAAFAAGGSDGQPGPQVTPAVDVFMMQHEITTGEIPVVLPVATPMVKLGPHEP
jgi:anti-sigma factor RsiW